jgi:hypothetical protein
LILRELFLLSCVKALWKLNYQKKAMFIRSFTMKKKLSLALALALTLSMLAACGGNSTAGSSSSSAASSSAGSQVSADASVSTPDTQPDQSASQQPPQSAAQEEQQPSQSAATLTLNRSDFTLKSAGATFKLKYTCEPDLDAIQEYTSSNESVATVSADGTVTAVAPGTAVITLEYGGMTASCTVRCNWTESTSPAMPVTPSTTTPSTSTTTPSAGTTTPAATTVDLSAFYSKISASYEFPMSMELADKEIQDAFYAGLSDIATKQCLVYANMMSNNMGELVLVQVSDSKDVSAVKAILQARIDNMVNGGAWYPEATEQWENCSAVVANGNYIMMVVNAQYAAIVKDFNAQF